MSLDDESKRKNRIEHSTMPASGTISEEHLRNVYAWAFRLLGRHQDALDVVQDVFVKWMQQCAKQPPDQPRGWLRRATLNRVIDLRRHEKTNQTHAGRIALSPEVKEEPLRDPDRSLRHHDLAAALGTITDIQRSVVVAKVYDGLTFAEIAAEHGLAISTVKTHYVRALNALHDRLHERWGDEEELS